MANKYRIKVEVIDGNGEELDKRYERGIECDGFAIIGNNEDEATVAIQHMNIRGLAEAISTSDDLYAASYIAQGYRKAGAITARGKLKGLADLFRGFGNEDDD